MLKRVLFASCLGLPAALAPAAARADETAAPCEPAALTCQRADVDFHKEIELPIEGGFDTGWIPANSPLQVHLFAQLFASTEVTLGGALETSWPEALSLDVPPRAGTGALGIHYGVDVGAEAMVQITVFGQTYTWTGPIPYIPQFDFQVEASTPFDPWAWQGVTVGGSTLEQTLAQVAASDFIGIDIPGLDGGFELNVKMDLDASYRTTAIHVRGDDGTLVDGGSILMGGQTTSTVFAGGPSVDLDVQPVGEVVYDGVLHLIPAFYIETIGPDFSIPIVDVPIPFTIEQKDWEFDPVRVHVPLPDITLAGDPEDPAQPEAQPTLDFGEVVVGSQTSLSFALANDGEALLAASFTSGPSGVGLPAGVTQVIPSGEATVQITFAPVAAGEVVGVVVLASNDPDEPERAVAVRGVGVEPAVVDPGPEGGGASDDHFAAGGGCFCRAARGPALSNGALALSALGALAALRRRRRR